MAQMNDQEAIEAKTLKEAAASKICKLRGTIYRAVPLAENPHRRQITEAAAKGPTVVGPLSEQPPEGSTVGSSSGGPKRRRTTSIVPRQNKLRNALLAGDTSFTCANLCLCVCR
jgi:hypothetical protein